MSMNIAVCHLADFTPVMGWEVAHGEKPNVRMWQSFLWDCSDCLEKTLLISSLGKGGDVWGLCAYLVVGVLHAACMLSHFSRVWLFVTLWTVARQAPLSMGFPRQEYWSGLPFPSPGDLPNPGIEAASPVSLALVGGFFTARAIWCSAYLVGKKDWGSQCSDTDGLQLCTAPALLLGSLGQVLSIS